MFVFVGVSQAAITSSKHDLRGVGGNTEDNTEICVYCHTPHGAQSSFAGAPLWNKTGTAGLQFRMYGATTNDTAGSTIAGNPTDSTVNAQSMACLSCHDGVSAINSVVNAPGSGLAGSAGADGWFGASALTIADVGANPDVTNIGNAGVMGYVDMTNDHPVSIQYVEGSASLKLKTDPLTGWSGATKIGDLLRGANKDRVECGSCHDPHMGENQTFLRVTSNSGSALCLGCHNK